MGGLARSGLLLVLAACASTHTGEGVVHVVRPGETLYRISRYYEVPLETVIRVNDVEDVSDVAVGTQLWIPEARRSAATASIALPAAIAHPGPGGRELALRESNLVFDWPVRGQLSSGYGRRGGSTHDGVDIRAPRGTPVRAAEAGRVIHSGDGLGDYGEVVILKHAGRYSTVYAHHDAIRVREGEFVEKGDIIGTVGTSGNASGPHLHFEVRRDRRPQDPLAYLP
jgi:murein DD-endopeptidase MepM/ murein hydrolase activator NlpD